MGVIDEPIVLPKLAFITAWQLAGITSELHPVLGTNHHYYLPYDARTRLHEKTWDALRQQRLTRRDSLSTLFRSTLETLAGADREYYGWCTFPGSNDGGAILVAASGRDAVRVLVDDTAIVIEPIGADWLPDDFVSALPNVPGAEIANTTVSASLYHNPHQRDANPLAEPPDLRPVEYLTNLMHAPRDAVHQLYTAIRRNGERVRSVPLSAIDLTQQGRILTYTNHDDNGDQHIHAVPGTPHNLITTLERTNQGL